MSDKELSDLISLKIVGNRLEMTVNTRKLYETLNIDSVVINQEYDMKEKGTITIIKDVVDFENSNEKYSMGLVGGLTIFNGDEPVITYWSGERLRISKIRFNPKFEGDNIGNAFRITLNEEE